MKQSKNEPLVLTGRVFTDKLLAHERPDLALSGPLRKGDLKIICVAKGHPTGVHGYSGFFVAYIMDGTRWRKFALRDGAAVKSTYDSCSQRQSGLSDLVRELRARKGRTAIWADRAYWLPNEPVAAVKPSAPAQAPAPAKPEGVTACGAAPVKPVEGSKPGESRKVQGQQLLLF